MGTSPAVASSPLIDPRPLVETVEDEEENTVGELIAAAELANETLTAPSETTNSPTSPSLTTAHVLPQRHQQRPSHRACQEALSHIFGLPKVHARPSRHPRVFQPRPTGWKPKRAAKRDHFQKRTHHYRDTHRTKHVSQPRTSPQVLHTPWRPSAPTSSRISHSEPPQKSFRGHLGLTYLLPIILGASLLRSLGWLLDMVSRGQPSLMFLQPQEVARWIVIFRALPAVASWILAAYLVGSLFRSFEQFSSSDAPDPHPLVSSADTLDPSSPNTIEPLLDLLIFRPPLLATSLHATSIDLPAEFPTRSGPLIHHHHPPFFSPAHGGATRYDFHPRYPLRLHRTALLHCPTVALLTSHPTLFPLLVIHFCSSSLISGGGGGGGGGGSSSSSSFSSPAPARRPNPSFTPTSWPSSHQRFRRRPLTPRHRHYLLLNLASRHDKRWLGCRQHIEAYRKFAIAHHLCDITTNMATLTTAEALHAILQAPTKLRDTMPKDRSFPIIWDSGASISVTNNKANFVEFLGLTALNSLLQYVNWLVWEVCSVN